MELRSEPGPPDLTLQLPRDMFYQLVHSLRAALPPPATNSPEDFVRRDNAAIATIASLLPANGDEANLAALYVAASAEALECQRLARAYPSDLAFVVKITARADSMMRQAKGFRSLLLRVQAVRQKRESNAASLDQAAWIEHCAIGLMAEALGRRPPAPMAEPAPAPAEQPAEAAEPPPDLAADADRYAIIYPRRAALIRSLGGLPARCDFGPPSPELVHAIVTGTSPTLRALDMPAEAEAAD
jgi:hypothetical protein